MWQLVVTTFIWAFSFSLIGQYLAGKVDIYIAIFIRFSLGALVLLPFFDFKILKTKLAFWLMGIGAIQIGIMYIGYFKSFEYLTVSEVALFTIFTPLYITLGNDLLNRKFSLRFLCTGILAVIGAAVIRYNEITSDFVVGFLLVQVANISFASGQLLYRYVIKNSLDVLTKKFKDRDFFFLFFIGALLPITPLLIFNSDFSKGPESIVQYSVLIWLGVVASGIGYLLWNTGARIVNSGFLAVMNNAVIPLAILVNLILWNGSINIVHFTVGSSIIVIAMGLNVGARGK